MTNIIFVMWLLWVDKPLFFSNIINADIPLSVDVLVTDECMFVLDCRDVRITKYDHFGRLQQDRVFKGNGPEELPYARNMRYLDGLIYVQGNDTLLVGDRNLTFGRRISMPSNVYSLKKVQSGWLTFLGESFNFRDQPLQLIWYSDSLEKSQVISEWEPENIRLERTDKRDLGGKVYKPVRDNNILAVSPDGGTAYVYVARTKEITILDGRTASIKGVITIDWPQYPFDREWGKKMLEYNNKRAAGYRPSRTNYEFPEYFPPIWGMLTTIENRLMIELYPPKFSSRYFEGYYEPHLLFFDQQGNKVKPTPFEADQRIIKVTGKWVFSRWYDHGEETHTIARLPREGALKALKGNRAPSIFE